MRGFHAQGDIPPHPREGLIADMDPIMRPWSIRDKGIWIRKQKCRKPDQESKNNGTDASSKLDEIVVVIEPATRAAV
jgi:hypothetical protein